MSILTTIPVIAFEKNFCMQVQGVKNAPFEKDPG
jgi:hypothetical protein